MSLPKNQGFTGMLRSAVAMVDIGNWRSLIRERYLIEEHRSGDETLLRVVHGENMEATDEDSHVESSDVSCDQFSDARGPGL